MAQSLLLSRANKVTVIHSAAAPTAFITLQQQMDSVNCTRLTPAEVSASAHGAAARTRPVFQSWATLFNNSALPAVSYQAQSSTASELAARVCSGPLHQWCHLKLNVLRSEGRDADTFPVVLIGFNGISENISLLPFLLEVTKDFFNYWLVACRGVGTDPPIGLLEEENGSMDVASW